MGFSSIRVQEVVFSVLSEALVHLLAVELFQRRQQSLDVEVERVTNNGRGEGGYGYPPPAKGAGEAEGTGEHKPYNFLSDEQV